MRVLIGTITRRRPKGLEALMRSWHALERPAGVEVHFGVVENEAEAASAYRVVERLKGGFDAPIHYALEPTPGIAFARNCVLDLGREVGAKFVLMSDDDQTVDSAWARTLIDAARSKDLQLVGGPNYFWSDLDNPPARFLVKHSHERAQIIAARAKRGDWGTIDIYTNNWCADREWLDAQDIRFDEALAFTGSEDTKLSRTARASGGRLGWELGAVTREELPPRRCTYGYIFRRSRDETTSVLWLQEAGRKQPAHGRVVRRVIVAALTPIGGLLRGRNELAKSAYKLGRAVGTLRFVNGRRSRHYAPEAAADHMETAARN